ncbi:hypothetical protein GUITHDRAFT_155037 [Guillardia theta CCMP2712]|uniref:Uncharacterized protein n=1 Tax=Guillardia theta (strain CCMP2712) TaxID=905079 RepID=L1IMR4_GUITC|nr:hypothetical protein GUITHDRAFT_155037 [Guillardia theta CCMP2712]EKX37105.1 hypothetical protein GUITHDRAFT_155037 [Guillardia theta CCMP2712]|eukprot:XP_005824085.1 hypothetical protein GUITHDRAFT_155037 [Guillardia theta CCMP2712]
MAAGAAGMCALFMTLGLTLLAFSSRKTVLSVAQRSRHQPSLLLQKRRVIGARRSMLADCVSWRGCSIQYDPETMDVNGSFYDRFDNYPNAWDASPAARYVRDLYPGGWPRYADEEPSVVVGGDPLKAYPFNDFGTGYGGAYDTYRSPNTYYY